MTPSPTPARFASIRVGMAAAMTLLILVMATLAGRHLTLGEQVIELHGYIGNAVFVLALANAALVVAAGLPGRDFALAVGLVLLMFAQIGLGYVGRDTAEAAAWHIPNGVLLVALSAYQLSEARRSTPVRPAPTPKP